MQKVPHSAQQYHGQRRERGERVRGGHTRDVCMQHTHALYSIAVRGLTLQAVLSSVSQGAVTLIQGLFWALHTDLRQWQLSEDHTGTIVHTITHTIRQEQSPIYQSLQLGRAAFVDCLFC